MEDKWVTSQVPFKYMLSDFVLLAYNLTLKVQVFKVISEFNSAKPIPKPNIKLSEGEQGYLIRSIPLASPQPVFNVKEQYIYYVPQQFNRCYIDLQQTFDEYISKFSSKTRSTIRRKIKKFSAKCDGNLHWRSYRSVSEIKEFYREARKVSSKSYQETLLDSGLPNDSKFIQLMESLSEKDQVRGYLLFDNDCPVAYMYCPIEDNVLLYQFLGYDYEYNKWSVGTILHWLAFEDIFNEKKFKYFDFTEGQSEHKRLYSTGSILCGNVYIFPKNIGVWMLIYSHHGINVLSERLGLLFERFGLKAKLKKIIRFSSSK